MMTPMRGFTLIETLVAVTLLATTIVLPYHAIQRSLIATYTSRDDLIASALAQEAVEYVRALRDSNYLYNSGRENIPRSWLYGVDGTDGSANCKLSNTTNKNNKCMLDPTKTTAVTVCPSGGCNTTLYLSTTNLYNQASSGTQTKFIRYFQLSCIDGTTSCNLENEREVRITATVTWNYHGLQTVTITDVLSNWL